MVVNFIMARRLGIQNLVGEIYFCVLCSFLFTVSNHVNEKICSFLCKCRHMYMVISTDMMSISRSGS